MTAKGYTVYNGENNDQGSFQTCKVLFLLLGHHCHSHKPLNRVTNKWLLLFSQSYKIVDFTNIDTHGHRILEIRKTIIFFNVHSSTFISSLLLLKVRQGNCH